MLGILKEEQISEVLERNIVGRIGLSDGKLIQVMPVVYLYDGKYIISHSREGMKIKIMRERPEVCFEVDEVHQLKEWNSVIIWGQYEELTDKRERYYALDRLIRKIHTFGIGKNTGKTNDLNIIDQTILPDEIKSIVYRIRIEKTSGRFEKH